ncbi:MAG: TetR/AcrR family transcriptional regulator [Deltaproteobacteria bacterium]|nr:MAG: TetR/AcrR family transcriptional regulator [Deltaproteobacteria bacterium]TDJ09481.1 MAG: TetR/AcrR family transcriptional regulator [Deltaproteobacteria bacterium]
MSVSRPARTKEAVVKDFRTSEILDAARRVIADVGYADASMERIAQKAGVSKGTLYLYFENKETLLVRTFEDGLGELIARARSATQRARGATAKLREIVRTGLEHSAESQTLFHAIREHSPLGSNDTLLLRTALQRQVEGYLGFVENLIERGIRARQLRRVDSRRAARFLMELIRGASIARLHDPMPPSLDEDVDTTLDFFLHGAGAGENR